MHLLDTRVVNRHVSTMNGVHGRHKLGGPGRFHTRALIMTFRMICAVVLTAILVSYGSPMSNAGPRAKDQPIFVYKGNTYIIRKTRRGQTTYLRSYRLAGDQWEPYGATSMPTKLAEARKPYRGTRTERIYTTGRLVGHSGVDLDNPLNTLLNKNFEPF